VTAVRVALKLCSRVDIGLADYKWVAVATRALATQLHSGPARRAPEGVAERLLWQSTLKIPISQCGKML
jgi:hypothetical protein